MNMHKVKKKKREEKNPVDFCSLLGEKKNSSPPYLHLLKRISLSFLFLLSHPSSSPSIKNTAKKGN